MDIYGPPLPPGFKQSQSGGETSDSEPDENAKKSALIGPSIPSCFRKRKSSNSSDSDSSNLSDARGNECSNMIGPVLPPSLCRSGHCDGDSDSELPFGPLPAVKEEDGVDDVVATVERRAKEMRNKLETSGVPVVEQMKREEWMTTPNTESRNQLGIISRCLTGDTESSKSSSSKKKASMLNKHSKRNEALSKELDEYNKSKRATSLLDMHRKAKKKKDKDDNKPKERKPFDRDTELAVRNCSKEQVNSVLKKAKYLNSRFSAGASQYL